MERLKDKVAAVTGAGSGIGREIALLFASEGAAMVVADCAAEAGEETVRQIRESGGEAIIFLTFQVVLMAVYAPPSELVRHSYAGNFRHLLFCPFFRHNRQNARCTYRNQYSRNYVSFHFLLLPSHPPPSALIN